jgi:hypothetical protein
VLADQIGAEAFFRLHEQDVIDAVTRCPRDHGIGRRQGHIPFARGQFCVVLGCQSGDVKFGLEPFAGKEAFFVGDHMGWAARITADGDVIHGGGPL